jgi:GTP-binding protein
MGETNFVDYVKIFGRSGRGGNGSAHLRHEKFNPKGGPDGGDGGRGGDIVLRGDAQLWTLLHLKFKKHIFAGDGGAGSANTKTGADGEDIIVNVPLGTVARDAEKNKMLFEITHDGEQKILVRGGRGGLGNTHFKSAIFQTPRFAQPGGPPAEGWFILELKVMADVGMVGFPNAGKSTLLSVISAARPRIDSYPFTTLTPNLGIVSYRDDKSFVMADIPGIIEGAHEGKGLGLRFLRHIERNSVLLFMIPCDCSDVKKEYHILVEELRLYNAELLDKKRVMAITKCDLIDEELAEAMRPLLPGNLPVVFISSIDGTGITTLKDLLWRAINS